MGDLLNLFIRIPADVHTHLLHIMPHQKPLKPQQTPLSLCHVKDQDQQCVSLSLRTQFKNNHGHQ